MQEVNKRLVRWLRGKVAAAKSDDLNLIPDSRGSVNWLLQFISDLHTCTLASVPAPHNNKQMLEK